MSDLAKRECVPCKGGIPPLKGKAVKVLQNELNNDWKVINEHHLEKEYRFKDFREAMDFTNKVGQIAEEQGHHPEICLTWGKVKISLHTHAVDGLTENDFILAAKADELLTSAGTL